MQEMSKKSVLPFIPKNQKAKVSSFAGKKKKGKEKKKEFELSGVKSYKQRQF